MELRYKLQRLSIHNEAGATYKCQDKNVHLISVYRKHFLYLYFVRPFIPKTSFTYGTVYRNVSKRSLSQSAYDEILSKQ